MSINRCVNRPFDIKSWCGRITSNDLIVLNLDSLMLNIIHNVKRGICPTCISEICHNLSLRLCDNIGNDNDRD